MPNVNVLNRATTSQRGEDVLPRDWESCRVKRVLLRSDEQSKLGESPQVHLALGEHVLRCLTSCRRIETTERWVHKVNSLNPLSLRIFRPTTGYESNYYMKMKLTLSLMNWIGIGYCKFCWHILQQKGKKKKKK